MGFAKQKYRVLNINSTERIKPEENYSYFAYLAFERNV